MEDDNTCVGPQCQMSARNRIHIERDVLIGKSVLIMDHDCAEEDDTPGIEGPRLGKRQDSYRRRLMDRL